MSLIEDRAVQDINGIQERDGVYFDNPWTYNDGCTAENLRSGVDGPHAALADQLCNLSGRQYE
jgi:hypothetical protein